MKQKDLITYGLIGLAVYFLFMKKEDKETEDTNGAGSGGAGSGGTNDNTPELATNGDKTSTEGNNSDTTDDYTMDRENFKSTSN